MNKNRKNWIINLKVLCCICVIMIHVISGWLDVNVAESISDIRWILDNVILQTCIRWAMPCFIMISGSLLLSQEKEISLMKIKKYIVRMLLVILIFGTGYSLIEIIYESGLDHIINKIFLAFFHAMQGKTWGHMWYVYMLIGLYILTPVLRGYIKNSSNKDLKILILTLFILSELIPTINQVFKINITTFYMLNFNYVFYYLFGYYLCNTTINSKKIKIIGILGFVGYLLISYLKKYGLNISLSDNAFIVLICTFIFYSFSHSKQTTNKYLENISKYSFGIYLTHTFWLNLINKGLGIYPSILPPLIGEIFFLTVVFLLSLLTSYILSKIYGFKKILN